MRLSDHPDKMRTLGVDGADLSGPVLDAKGFLLVARPEPAGSVTLQAPGKVLRYLAHMIEGYFDANPSIDNEEVDMDGLDAREEGLRLLQQLRDQGVEPPERRE